MRLGVSGLLTKHNREKLNDTQNREGPQKDDQKNGSPFSLQNILFIRFF